MPNHTRAGTTKPFLNLPTIKLNTLAVLFEFPVDREPAALHRTSVGMRTFLSNIDRNFPVLAGAAIVIVAVGLGALSLNSISHEMVAVAKRNNIALTRTFANFIWPRVRDFMPMAGSLPTETLRQHPKIAEIRQAAVETTHGVPILKVKIYDPNGRVVYSTETQQIGEYDRDDAGFLAARAGRTVNKLSHKDRFAGFETVVRNREILASYVPIQARDGSVLAVFEAYYDMTDILPRIKHAEYLQVALVIVAFLSLYLIILRLVRLHDSAAAEHHQKALDLSRKAMLAEEAANKTKSAFLANMSHELRTPLNAILGYADFMRLQRLGAIGSPKYLEYLNDIINSGRHLLSIIGDVLDLSQIEAGKAELDREVVDLPPLIGECVQIVAPPGDVEMASISQSIDPALPPAFLDARRFRQILINLLSNARKFTPNDGSIEIFAYRAADEGLEIGVADTGPGMTPDEIAVAMLPFGRANTAHVKRTNGYGLGLPLTRSLVELHGGTLAIDSARGKGTRVTIRLPSTCIADHSQDAANS